MINAHNKQVILDALEEKVFLDDELTAVPDVLIGMIALLTGMMQSYGANHGDDRAKEFGDALDNAATKWFKENGISRAGGMTH